MKSKSVIAGTLVAGVLLFFLGWIIYGILLSDFMAANFNQGINKPTQEMVWWALIVSNLAWGLLTAVVLSWKGRLTAGEGAVTGAVIGMLVVLAFDLGMYSMTTMFSGLTAVGVDVICNGAMFAVAGAVAALVMGKMNVPVTS